MKTINFLFISAIVAFLSVSCEKGLECCEKKTETTEEINKLDSLLSIENADSTINESPDSTVTEDPDSVITENSESTNTESSESIITLDNPNAVSGKGEIATLVVNLTNFTEVELKKIGEVEIVGGSEYKVEISDYENLLPFAKVYLEGERLVISYDDIEQVMGSKLKISITIPDKLSKCIIAGSGNINVQSGYSSDNVQLMVSGAGNILATNINSHSVNIDLPGSGVIEAKGTTSEFSLQAKGSGTIKCEELMCTNANCNIGGVCNVFLGVTGNLNVDAMGIGTLTYYGNPVLKLNLGMQYSVIEG
ncbi:MAG: DUF2807 domain-containing protein [Bacteroidales bacterium]|nr:DUF2807 domain-containing protein [Bacteroidales bacterium]